MHGCNQVKNPSSLPLLKRLWAFGCALVLATASHGAGFDAHPKLQDLPERWAPLMEDLYVPGAAVAVIDDGEVYMETFGHRNAEQTLPVNEDTMFYIGSVTKTYTTAALMALAKSGHIRLDDRVIDHLPRFRLSDGEVQDRIRIRDLLTHRYGIDAPVTFVRLEAYTGELTQERFLYWIGQAMVRGNTHYTNEHFEIAGRVIEAVTGEDWREYLREALLEPAGLDRTTGYASILWDDDNAAMPLLPTATGYRLPVHLKTDRTMHPAGGLGASLEDAARFLQLHLDGGTLDGEAVLPRNHVREAMTLAARYPEPQGINMVEIGRTLGWESGMWADRVPVVYHGGGYSGATAWYGILPRQNAGIVFLMNSDVPAFGWVRIVMSDLLTRLSGAESAVDRYDEVLGQIEAGAIEGMRIGPAPPPEAMTALDSGALSMPLELYAGHYHSEHLGTLSVRRCDRALCFHLGDAPIPVEAGEGKDSFRIPEFIRSKGRFVVSPGGEVNKLVIEADGETFGRHEFSR